MIIFIRFLLLLCVGSYLAVDCTFAATITALSLKEKAGLTTANYPLTFGHIFKNGDVSQYAQVRYNGSLLATQCDVKTTYSNNSVRFAVISVVLPSITANSTNTISLETQSLTASGGYMDKSAIISSNIEDEIRLTNISGSGYSGALTADLNAQIAASSNLSYWLQGSVASEILIRQQLNNSLEASWEVRYYPGTSFGPRISHSIENINADYRGIINYNVDIQAGQPTLSSRYSKSSVQHNEDSRWRKVLWVGVEPPEVELHYDLSYLISTGAFMNYDASLTIPSETISAAYTNWLSTDHDIMGNGSIMKAFGTVGGREEIGILPTWSARYLLSMDNRMREIVIGNGEMAGHIPIHYRESNSGKAFYRKPVSVDDRPTIWTDEWRISTLWGDAADRLPLAIGDTYLGGWSPDMSHQGSFAYLPYLITGEKYFLDEMYYWAFWNISASSYHPEWGRNYSQGLLRDQVRGEAWGIRNIADAAAFSADEDIAIRSYLNSKISNNIDQWLLDADDHPLGFWGLSGDLTADQVVGNGLTSDVKRVALVWQDDFVLLSLYHMSRLGYNVSALINAFSSMIINRFTASGTNPYHGIDYYYPGMLSDGSNVSTWAQATSKFSSQPTEFPPVGYAYSYYHIALSALSQITHIQGGAEVYEWLLSKWNPASSPSLAVQFSDDPTWAIIPGAIQAAKSRYRLGSAPIIQSDD